MADSGSRSTIIGCVGVLCLAVYWAAMFFTQVANILPDSSFGKFVVFSVFLAGVPLTVVAAIRGRRRRLSRKSQKRIATNTYQAPFMGAAITKERAFPANVLHLER
jgi:hypothetical protein